MTGTAHPFPLGRLMMTRGVAAKGFAPDVLMSLLERHQSGDFGDINDDDRQENLHSIEHDLRILSAYTIQGTKLWVITEADRSVTTILQPDEY